MNKFYLIILLFTNLLFSIELVPDSVYTMDEVLMSRQGVNGSTMLLQDFVKASGFNNELIIITHHATFDKKHDLLADEEICFYSAHISYLSSYWYSKVVNELKLIHRLVKDKFDTYNYQKIIPVKKLDEGEGQYVIITQHCPGSGHFVKIKMYEFIYQYDGYVREVKVEFDNFKKFLKEDQMYYKGYEIDYNNGYSFKRNIYNKGDCNAGASGGKIEGNFRLIKKGTKKEPVIFFKFDDVNRYDEPIK